MAPKYISFLLLILFSCCMIDLIKSEPQHPFYQTLKPSKLGLKREKLTHLHFFFHDVLSAPNPTAVPIIKSTTNSTRGGFGLTMMADDPLTQGPNITSKLVGKAQGLYGLASQGTDVSLVMLINYAFLVGKFNGSTLSILGRNNVFDKVREFPIVGGTGVFRFARGFAQARTHFLNVTTGDAIVEYNVYVFHH